MTSKRAACFLLTATLAFGCADFERGDRVDAWVPPPDTSDNTDGTDDGPTFDDVYAPLADLCGLCHVAGGAAGATTFVLSDDIDADYDMTIALIDTADPSASLLLTKGTNQTTHAGGESIKADSSEYSLLLTWIGAGGSR